MLCFGLRRFLRIRPVAVGSKHPNKYLLIRSSVGLSYEVLKKIRRIFGEPKRPTQNDRSVLEMRS